MFDLHIITDALHIPKNVPSEIKKSLVDRLTGILPVLTTSKLQNKRKLDKRQDIMDLLRKKDVSVCDPSSCCLRPTHTHSAAQQLSAGVNRTGDISGNCSTIFPFYISFL